MFQVTHAFPLNGQAFIVLDDGACYTLGRRDGDSRQGLEWQELPPVPRSEREQQQSEEHA